MHDDVGAHLHERLGEAEPVLVHRLVDDRLALGLREGDDERLLPVRHEAGVHVGLDDDGLERAAAAEADAVLVHVERAADLAEDVEEREHLLLLGAADEDVAVGRERGARPRGGLVAVEDAAVVVALQRVDALDEDHAVGLVRDDRAHLLQHRDEIHDLGLDRGVAQLGDALRLDGGEQHLLGRADARVRQLDVRAVQAVRAP